MTALPNTQLKGRTPHGVLTGDTPNILPSLQFEWNHPYCYLNPVPFPGDKSKLGRWLGFVHKLGQRLCYRILSTSEAPIECIEVQPLTDEELIMPVIKRKNFKQNREIKLKVGDEAEKRDTNPILKAMDHEELEELADGDDDAYPYEP